MSRSPTLRALGCAGAFLCAACSTVGPGHVGVLWRATSGTESSTYGEGAHWVSPWNNMSVYDLRAKSNDEKLSVIAVNGLAIQLDATVRFHLIPQEVIALQEQIGPDYYHTILEPVLRSEARRVIGRYTPEEIYSTKRDVIERETRQGVEEKIAGKHIALEAVLIRNVDLPDAIRVAIDQKLAAEQEVLKMKYVLEVARSRAEERRIEAKGIADYNHMITSSLTPGILEYEKVRELEALARSSNAKTVVLGPGATQAHVLLQTPTGGQEKAPTPSRSGRAPPPK
ncbi:MAG TPA: prohibitin family protein [Anaeromyxobacteraceae bacterium]|nr:prohibitin family protein [Anaeromyxobacteraceae bacterium]